MKRYSDCPQILREFLIYHENIKGQSKLTISEYYLDLRMFLLFIKLMRSDMPIHTQLDEIDIKNIDEDYSVYLDAVNGHTHLKEGSTRCYKCYNFRLKKLSDYASKNNFDYFSTVMSVSPYKNSKWINELGNLYQDKSIFLYSNFKKENGYKESVRMSFEYELYRQDYCGCEFSLKEHIERLESKVRE